MGPIRWLGIDPGDPAGVAIMHGTEVVSTGVVRPIGKLGRWAIPGQRWEGSVVPEVRGKEGDAWREVLRGASVVVCEACGFGLPRSALAALSRKIGGIERMAELAGATFLEINVESWRRVIAESWSREFPERTAIVWPRGKGSSAQCKVIAQSLVLQLYDLSVTPDEAEAVLIARAAMRLRLVDLDEAGMLRVVAPEPKPAKKPRKRVTA